MQEVGKALQLSFLFCLFWGLMMAAILAVAAPTLVAFFNPNPDIVAIASQYLWIVPISYAGAGIIYVASSAFNALGKPIPSVVMTVARDVRTLYSLSVFWRTTLRSLRNICCGLYF